MKSEQALFGERLRNALKAAGYPESASELARLITRHGGVPATPQAISRWLHGKCMPRQRNLKALAQLLRIPPSELQYGSETTSRIREPRVEFRIPATDQHAIDALREHEQKKKR